MVICVSKKSQTVLVLNRTPRSTRFIHTVRQKRKVTILRNSEFDRTYKPIYYDYEKAANRWLASPLPMTPEVRKELQMIIALKKNSVVGKYEDATQAPEGTEIIEEAGDLKGRSLKSLTALYKKLGGNEETKFETEDEATAAVWGQMELYEPPVKEEKVKAVREKLELKEAPKNFTKASTIQILVKENPRRDGGTGHANYSNYVEGMTVAEFLAKPGAHLGHLRWDVKHGYVAITEIPDPPKPVKEKVVKETEAPA